MPGEGNIQGESGRSQQRNAYSLRNRFDWLNQFTDDELRDIALCDEETPLREGAQYFDISHPEKGLVVAKSGDRAPRGSCYVWREDVAKRTWDKLLGYGKAREAS